MQKRRLLTKSEFWLLSCTWGIILTCVGFLAAGVLLMTGHPAKKYGWGWYFELGEDWGGCSFGPVFVKCKTGGEYLRRHEYGHAVQNAFYGPFMLLLVNLPSMTRYWLRRIAEALGKPLKNGYYDIWFEKQASDWGMMYIEALNPDVKDKG